MSEQILAKRTAVNKMEDSSWHLIRFSSSTGLDEYCGYNSHIRVDETHEEKIKRACNCLSQSLGVDFADADLAKKDYVIVLIVLSMIFEGTTFYYI